MNERDIRWSLDGNGNYWELHLSRRLTQAEWATLRAVIELARKGCTISSIAHGNVAVAEIAEITGMQAANWLSWP